MKLLVVYIATGKYAEFWEGFERTLPLLAPEAEIEICAFSDVKLQSNKYVVHNFQISHSPWPIVALMKFRYILQAADVVNADYVAYFDSKMEFCKETPLRTLIPNFTRVSVFPHSEGPEYPDGRKLAEIEFENRHSHAGIGWEYEYVQSSLFAGSVTSMKRMCEILNNKVELDLLKRTLPAVDDESYLNWYAETQRSDVLRMPRGFLGCTTDPLCKAKDPYINMRDHGAIEYYKYKLTNGDYLK